MRRSRRVLLCIGLGVLVAGLLLRTVPGFLGDLAGGILYAVLVCLVIAIVTPSAPGLRIGALALVVCAAIELLQLTGLPSTLGTVFPPLRLLLGTTFVATDLLAYAVGAAAAVAADRVFLRRRQR